MRLWHADLIPVLPRQQLLGQNRECCLIEREIIEKGRVNHLLVNFVNDDKQSLLLYHSLVTDEMLQRGYKVGKSTNEWKLEYGLSFIYTEPTELIYPDKFTDRYLTQCLYNLQEKHDCG